MTLPTIPHGLADAIAQGRAAEREAMTVEPEGETLDFGGFKVRIHKAGRHTLFLQSDLGDGRRQRVYFTQNGCICLESRNGGPWREVGR